MYGDTNNYLMEVLRLEQDRQTKLAEVERERQELMRLFKQVEKIARESSMQIMTTRDMSKDIRSSWPLRFWRSFTRKFRRTNFCSSVLNNGMGSIKMPVVEYKRQIRQEFVRIRAEIEEEYWSRVKQL